MILNESNVYDLMEAIVQQASADYHKANRLLSKCKSRDCRHCKKPLDQNCMDALKDIYQFFDGDMFYLAYPYIDNEWIIKQIEEDKYPKTIRKREIV